MRNRIQDFWIVMAMFSGTVEAKRLFVTEPSIQGFISYKYRATLQQ